MKGKPSLVNQATHWPTPAAMGWKDNGEPSNYERNTPGLPARAIAMAGGSGLALNPEFVEALMGYPCGWTLPETTGCAVSETPLCPSKQQQPSSSVGNDSSEDK